MILLKKKHLKQKTYPIKESYHFESPSILVASSVYKCIMVTFHMPLLNHCLKYLLFLLGGDRSYAYRDALTQEKQIYTMMLAYSKTKQTERGTQKSAQVIYSGHHNIDVWCQMTSLFMCCQKKMYQKLILNHNWNAQESISFTTPFFSFLGAYGNQVIPTQTPKFLSPLHGISLRGTVNCTVSKKVEEIASLDGPI